jgi:ubiquitin C-terminal hydrolase
MKWWVESDFKAPNLPLSLRLRGSGCHYNSIMHCLQRGHHQNTIRMTLVSVLFRQFGIFDIAG